MTATGDHIWHPTKICLRYKKSAVWPEWTLNCWCPGVESTHRHADFQARPNPTCSNLESPKKPDFLKNSPTQVGTSRAKLVAFGCAGLESSGTARAIRNCRLLPASRKARRRLANGAKDSTALRPAHRRRSPSRAET